mmetsp:Transcript_24046/g.94725  ORF Transcript_24046/g.94725 Transcript_24046/m.94725 type:complete len:509 (-) Transcript_24046:898-2424(-)
METKTAVEGLKEEEVIAKMELLAAYKEFWDHEKFHQGLTTASVDLEVALPYLEVAAEIVVKIRAELDVKNPGLKDRLVGGSASEYLWGVCGDPEKAPKAFIRAVVHATLSDADGYVEDLTEQGIDDYIVKFGGEQMQSGAKGPDMLVATAQENMSSKLANLQKKIESLSKQDESFSEENMPSLNFNAHVAYHRFNELMSAAEQELVKIINYAAEKYEDAEISKAWEDAFPLPSELVRRRSTRPKAASPLPAEAPADVPAEDDKPPEEQKEDVEKAVKAGEIQVLKVAGEVDVIAKDMATFVTDAKAASSLDGTVDPRQALKVVESLEKKSLQFTDTLMKELLALDNIHIPREREDARLKRKAQVLAVQQLMNDLDSVMEKLKVQHKTLAAEAEKLPEEEKAVEPVKPAVSATPSGPTAGAPATDQSAIMNAALARLWPKLRLKPKFEVNERPDGVIISALIPGMNPEDITIRSAEDFQGPYLLVRGRRLPSPGDVDLMKEQLELQLKR